MFIASKDHPTGRVWPIERVRLAIVVLYVGYPLGCLLRILSGDGTALSLSLEIAGLALVVVAGLAFLLLGSSTLQRIVHERTAVLDEREIAQRWRAHETAYTVLCSVVLIGLLHLQLAADFGDERGRQIALWVPTTGTHWSAVFLGLFMLAMTLPAAVMAFTQRALADEA